MNDMNVKKSTTAKFEDIQVWKDGGSSLYELLSLDNFHFHNVIEIGICESGEGVSEVDGRREIFSTGDILIVFPFQHHRNYSRDIAQGRCKVRWTYIEISGVSDTLGFKDFGFFDMIQKISVFGVIRHVEYPELYISLEDLLKTVIDKRGEFRSLSIHSKLSLSLVKMVELSKNKPEDKVRLPKKFYALPPVIDYLNDKIAGGEMPKIKELASVARMSLSNFRHTFSSIMNISPKEYVIYATVQKACILLLTTSLPIRAVSDAVGFMDLSTFIRAFKNITGTTPKTYRERSNKQN